MLLLGFSPDIHFYSVVEDQRVQAWMRVLEEFSAGTSIDFQTNQRRCHAMVQLHDQASKVNRVAEKCRSILAMLFGTLFPRNSQPRCFHYFGNNDTVAIVFGLIHVYKIIPRY
jgi:hypothetical protein